MNEYIRVEDDPNLYRNIKTGAVINVNDQAYENYMRRKSKISKKDKEIQNLKNELSEIKDLLKTLLDNNK
tara:strand:- start:5956 stop:6165 length:210 start_codon:yes stop_codon:yes gene_type:complete